MATNITSLSLVKPTVALMKSRSMILPVPYVTREKVFDSLSEKRFAEARIAFYTRPDCFLEILRQSHCSHLPAP